MEYHVDKNNFNKKYLTEKYWAQFPHGDYLVMRINRTIKDQERRMMINNLFGIKKYRIGAVKILPIEKANKDYIRKYMKELYISAFKVVV